MELDLKQSEPPRRRRRPALSCLACRRKKVSCNRAQPCNRCIAAGSPCTYRIESGISNKHKHLAETPRSADAGRIRTANDGTTTETLSPAISISNRAATPGKDVESRTANRIKDLEQRLLQLNQRVQELQKSSHRGYIINEVDPAAMPRLHGFSTTLNRTKFSKLSHWVATPPEFSNIVQFFKHTALFKQLVEGDEGTLSSPPAISSLIEETVKQLETCKYLARSMKIGRPSRLESTLWFNVAPPPREVADTMAESYFKYFESAYRILHTPTFLSDYDRYWRDPEAAPMALRLEVCLVVAIGSSVTDQTDMASDFRSKAHEVVYAAQVWLSGPFEKHRVNLKAIQIHCLTMLARQIIGIGGDLVWTSMGQLMHEAMQIGLHRDPKHLMSINHLDSELRRRVWATILEMTVQSSFNSEMPPRILLEEFDTEPPANIDDDEVNESTTELPSHAPNTYTMTSAQLLLLSSLPTRLRVAQFLSSTSSDIPYAECLELSTSLTKACGSLSMLRQERGHDSPAFHRSFADYLTRRFLLYLHGPFSYHAGINQMFSYSRKACVDAAMAIMSSEQDETFRSLMVTSGGIFKTGIRYAGVAIGVELIAQCRAQLSDHTLSRNTEYRDVLKREVKRHIHLSEERIKHGESNVKNHTFLSMILAEAESIEQGSSTELAIAQSARDSLAYCHDLLLAQQGSIPTSQFEKMAFASFEDDIAEFAFDFDVDEFLQGSLFS